MRGRTTRLQHLFGEFELDASLGLSVRERLVRQQGWVTDDRGASVPELVCDPFAVTNEAETKTGTGYPESAWTALHQTEEHEKRRGIGRHTHYFSMSALMVPVYLLCRCSSCEAAVYRRSDILRRLCLESE